MKRHEKKSVIPLLLCLALIVGLLAGCGGQDATESPGAEEPIQSEAAAAELDEVTLLEYERAIGYGFMPDGLEDEAPDSYIVTWSEFCDMLGRMISSVDEGALPAWEEMTAGASDGTNAEGEITREQLVTMLWRCLGKPSAAGALEGWSDAGEVSAWAREAMAWAVEAGIITGDGEALSPRAHATRAQCAAILMRSGL